MLQFVRDRLWREEGGCYYITKLITADLFDNEREYLGETHVATSTVSVCLSVCNKCALRRNDARWAYMHKSQI